MKTIILPNDCVVCTHTSDWHLASVPPGRRRNDYQEAILKKISFVRDLTAQLNGINLTSGDAFHIKNPRSFSNNLSMIAGTMQLLGSFPQGKVLGIPGNHDCLFDHSDALSLSSQPLGILMASGVYHNVAEESVLLRSQDGSVSVLVEGLPYVEEKKALELLVEKGEEGTTPPGVDYRVMLLHAYGAPGGAGNLFGADVIGYNQLESLEYDVVFWGHDHSRKKTVQVGNTLHVNLGSLARAALSSDEVDRPVVASVLYFQKEGFKYKEVKIPVQPLDVAFTTADKATEKVRQSDEVNEFFEAMEEATDNVASDDDPRQILKTLCGENAVLFDTVIGVCEL
jgi:DNA repair exonuclease SbcCD nuclease subunit